MKSNVQGQASAISKDPRRKIIGRHLVNGAHELAIFRGKIDARFCSIDGENDLSRIAYITGLVQSDIACIDAGLTAGELVIVSDPVPAIEGMLVDAILDHEVQERLVADAKGEDERE